jgi:hypothetical protein
MERRQEESKIRLLLRNKAGGGRERRGPAPIGQKDGLLLQEHSDVFRLVLGRDPPVKTEPLRVQSRPGARPVRSQTRRYPAEHREFMRRHVEALAEAGMVYRNPGSRWSSPPLIVKGEGGLRMTVDVRVVNSQAESPQWPMSLLEVVIDHEQGATVFSSSIISSGTGSCRCNPHAKRCFRSSPIWVPTPRLGC